MTFTYFRIGRELWGSQSIGECTQKQIESVKSKRKVSTTRDIAYFINIASYLINILSNKVGNILSINKFLQQLCEIVKNIRNILKDTIISF